MTEQSFSQGVLVAAFIVVVWDLALSVIHVTDLADTSFTVLNISVLAMVLFAVAIGFKYW